VSGPQLVVNADDFGTSAGVNAGVQTAFERGIVTSTSLMVLQPAAEAAAAYGREHPELGLGLHVDLGEWYAEGEVWRARYERVDLDDVAAVGAEVRRQLDRFRELVGRPPTHLDSHQHVHTRPGLAALFVAVADEHRLPLRATCSRARYCGSFYGQTESGEPLPDLVRVAHLTTVITTLPEGVTELACHPAATVDFESTYATERILELETLCDPRVRAAVDNADVTLVDFRSVGS
jgi:predicted glycoside hydrolase/deacetylase ChbG (UPF0249 family)